MCKCISNMHNNMYIYVVGIPIHNNDDYDDNISLHWNDHSVQWIYISVVGISRVYPNQLSNK